MRSSSTSDRARRYVGWLARHRLAIVVASLVVLAVAVDLVAFHLPLTADLADLLPGSAPAVVDLHKLDARLVANDTVLVIVDAPDPAACGRATRELSAALHRIGPELVVRIDEDQAEARAFLWEHRFQLAPQDELERADRALKARLDAARLAANPLYVDLDDRDPAREAADRAARQELADLRARRRDVEAALHRPSNLSKDGRRALIEVRAAMPATDIERGTRLLDALEAARRSVHGARIGFAGDLVTAIAEHDAIVDGTLLSSIATAVLVGLVLALFFRSLRLLVLLVGTIGFATLVAFATAVLTVGRLNAATAFLGAIIAGNGINYGILLIARFLQARRTEAVEPALATAIADTLRPTAVASLGAAIAYGSLAATSFRGFADFAIIGSTGMLLCWVATYLVLPALVLLCASRTTATVHERLLDRALVGLLGVRRPRVVVAIALALALAAGAVVVRFVASDPFEYDMRELGSVAEATETERTWMQLAEATFGRGRAGRTFIAADRADQVEPIVAALARPALREVVGSVQSILDVVPAHQAEKIKLVDHLRAQLDEPILDELDARDRDELRELRPPDGLTAITREMLPRSIVELLAEKSGRFGLLVSVRPADGLDELDGHDVIRFASAVRSLDLANGEVLTTSGASVVFADILQTIAADGPRVTALALGGLALMLVLVLGFARRTLAVMAATLGGSLLMVATCAVLGIKVNFLDFVALPITLGLGVDYGINMARRGGDAIATLRACGAEVFVCSLTTMIGYGSLLVSDNLAIRGFGRASLIGEIATVLAALVLVPAILGLGAKRAS